MGFAEGIRVWEREGERERERDGHFCLVLGRHLNDTDMFLVFRLCFSLFPQHSLLLFLFLLSSTPFSMTRLGDLLDFGQIFKAFVNN